MTERIEDKMIEHYRNIVLQKHPTYSHSWPLISGYNSKVGSFKTWLAVWGWT